MTNIPINADIFIESWKAFSKEFTSKNHDWGEIYYNNTAWSNKFLGGKKSSSNDSPIGEFFKKKFGFHYRTEHSLFDIVFSSADNYKQIPYINRKEILNFDIEKQFFPVSYDIIIEIENVCAWAWQEMAKLTSVRCPLKVLVTYHNNNERMEEDMLEKTFQTVILQSNKHFAENTNTEYLLIIGNNIDKTLNWTFFKFDSNGKSLK